MTAVKKHNGVIKVGNGHAVEVMHKGCYKAKIKTPKGERTVTLNNVLVAPNVIGNLFSITRALEAGAQLTNDGSKIVVKKGKTVLRFDERVKSMNGFLLGLELKPSESAEGEEQNQNTKKTQVNMMHRKLGHASEAKTRATAK